jgi:hypothetical protein
MDALRRSAEGAQAIDKPLLEQLMLAATRAVHAA